MPPSYHGYPFRIIHYNDAEEECKEPLSQRVVISVVKNFNFHRIYMDKFFNPHGLIIRLQQK